MVNVTHPPIDAASREARWGAWSLSLPLIAALITVVMLYRDTAESMLSTWLEYDTYRYGLLVVPLFVWLLWRLRHRLLAAPWQPAWWAVGLALVSGAFWLVGELGEANSLRQFALVSMSVFALVAVLGRQRARLALFPLAFLIFAVPFGEGAVPTLMDWTADATVVALRLSGVPVYREGLWFVLPSGSWSVIEACSGVKFLLTAIVVGSLFAYLMYRSQWRRAFFMFAAVAVALLANWLRAYLTVLLGHVSDNRLMSGHDHVVFGWILFALAITALFGIGARFAQAPAPMLAASIERTSASLPWLAAALALGAVVFWPRLADHIEGASPAASETASVPVAATGGWIEVGGQLSAWQPTLVGPRSVTVQRFQSGEAEVELHVAVFEFQRKGAELATSVNRLVLDADPTWRLASVTELPIKANALPPRVRSARIRAGDRTYAVWHWMVSDGQPTLSVLKGKADVVRARVLGRSDRAFWVALLVPVDEARPDVADELAQRFVVDMGQSLARALEVRS